MNRSFALFVALAVLVAHSFAIHGDSEGGLAAPYSRAYAAFRLARNLVHENSLAWIPGVPGLDAYPSLLWVGLCALGERLYLGINQFAQAMGVLFALATVVVVSRLHPDRAASLIAPLLLAISGGMAAAGVSGLETTLVAFLLTGAFLTFERGLTATTSLALLGLGLARPEGWVLCIAFALLRALQGIRSGSGAPRVAPWAFAPALAGFILLALLRRTSGGPFVGPELSALATLDPGELAAGFGGLWDFVRVAASPLLVLYAVWYLLRGRLSATGTRALSLGLAWCAVVTVQGGGVLPFYANWVPALPLLLIAAQEGMITALNSPEGRVRGLAWTAFLGAVMVSALASRSPGDLAGLPLADWQRAWMEPSDRGIHGADTELQALGREALEDELRVTRYLRTVGIFFREHLPPDTVIATPWPEAVGYLSRLAVHDLLGRLTPIEPGGPLRPWDAPQRVDLLAALERRSPHLFLTLENDLRAPTPTSLTLDLASRFDIAPDEEPRLAKLRELLAEYELITVPIADAEFVPVPFDDARAYLLRRRELDLAPTLDLVIEESSVVVTMRHTGHVQLAELRVRGRDFDGEYWHLTPNGRFVDIPVMARAHLLVHATGERVVELIRAPLPTTGPTLISLEAVLVNPGTPNLPQAFAAASNDVRVELPR